jgi:hypothetical protein
MWVVRKAAEKAEMSVVQMASTKVDRKVDSKAGHLAGSRVGLWVFLLVVNLDESRVESMAV